MLGMGAATRPRDYLDVLREPRAFCVGALVQLTGAPAIAVAVNAGLDPPLGLALGLILVASIPGGTISNVFTYLARGNVPLSISLTAVTTLGSLVVTPLLLAMLMGAHVPDGFEMPVRTIATEICLAMLLPLAIGMAAGAALPARRDGLARWCIRGSVAVIALIVVGAASAGRVDPDAFGWIGPGLILCFAITLQQLALLVSRTAGLAPRDRVAIAVEVTIRNTNLALLIKASLFPVAAGVADPIGDGVFFVLLLYGGGAIVVVLPILVRSRRRERS